MLRHSWCHGHHLGALSCFGFQHSVLIFLPSLTFLYKCLLCGLLVYLYMLRGSPVSVNTLGFQILQSVLLLLMGCGSVARDLSGSFPVEQLWLGNPWILLWVGTLWSPLSLRLIYLRECSSSLLSCKYKPLISSQGIIETHLFPESPSDFKLYLDWFVAYCLTQEPFRNVLSVCLFSWKPYESLVRKSGITS